MLYSAQDALQFVFLGLGLLGFLQALLLLLHVYENTRFFQRRLRSPVRTDYVPRVHLIMPCKGVEASFAETVNGVLRLDYPSYRLTFVVESRSDPAHARLLELLAEPPGMPTRLVVAGRSHDCGQKVHNLLAATAELDEDTEVLAFVDSDTLPDPDWLRRLVRPLHRERAGVVTGYRWFMAAAGDWPGTVLAALNAGVAFALGNHPWNQVWGGSWAIRRSTFAKLRQQGVWTGALTEDLPIGRGVRRLGLRVVYEPNCLVSSPVRGSWPGLVEFVRRQYLITRVYAPGQWWFVFLTKGLYQGVFWGGVLSCCCLGPGNAAGLLLGLLAVMFGLNAACAFLRWRAVVRCFPGQGARLRRVAWLDLLAHPLLGLGHLLLVLSSACGRCLTWRGIRYRLHGPHHTEILFRPSAQAAPAPSRFLDACLRRVRPHGSRRTALGKGPREVTLPDGWPVARDAAPAGQGRSPRPQESAEESTHAA
jgi:hypothetical protein